MKKYLVFIIAFSFLFLSYLPNIYEASIVDLLPKDRVMVWGEHIYTYDYNVYLSKIRQGAEGRWSIVDKYDNNTNQKGVFLQMLYLFSGKITSFLEVSPVLTYHLLRVVTSFIWVYAIIWLCIHFLKKPGQYTLGVVLCLLATSFPKFYTMENQLWMGSYMDWWQELDIVKRISFIPHDTLNYVAIAIFTLLLSLYAKTHKKIYLTSLCIGLFFSLFIQPSAGIVFFLSWLLFNSVRMIWTGSFNKKNFIEVGKQTAIFAVVILLPLLYIKFVTSTYPWKSLIDFDKIYRLSINIKEYILALGPIFFTGLAGLALVFYRKNIRLLPVATWFLGAWIGILAFKFFPYQSELRFIQTANHVPLSILSVYFFHEIWLKKRIVWNTICYLAVFLIIVLGIGMSYFSIRAQNQFIHQRAVATIPPVPYPPQVMYPIADFYNGLKWLGQKTPRSSIVLSKFTAGNYIPAYAGNFVYFGHNPESSHFDEKAQMVEFFFSGNMSASDARNFLADSKINYVFYGPQEKEGNNKNIADYPFLSPEYRSPNVIIFRVK